MQQKEADFSYRLWRHDGAPGELIPLLQSAQEHFGYIPRRAIKYISGVTRIPESTIYGVITFYSQFRLQPMGRYVIRLCTGTACHVRGAARVLHTTEELTGIGPGETDLELRFSLETVNCLGCCALGPVMEIDGKTHGKLAPGETADVLKNYE